MITQANYNVREKVVISFIRNPHSAVQKYNFAKFTGLVLITNEQIRYS